MSTIEQIMTDAFAEKARQLHNENVELRNQLEAFKEHKALVYQLWLAWGGDDGDPEELLALVRLIVNVRHRALAKAYEEIERLRARIQELEQ